MHTNNRQRKYSINTFPVRYAAFALSVIRMHIFSVFMLYLRCLLFVCTCSWNDYNF